MKDETFPAYWRRAEPVATGTDGNGFSALALYPGQRTHRCVLNMKF